MENSVAAFPSEAIVVTQLCRDLLNCVEKILNPTCTLEERNACNETIANFKETHKHCMHCGFKLAQDQNPVARHFGLQLIEHVVKHRWGMMEEMERYEYLQELLQHIKHGMLQTDELFVKEAVARLTVETAKQMWPQLWSSFINDMAELYKIGPIQLELVLIIFRRLAEDIYLYESGLDQKRKKEMIAALDEQIHTIFKFLLQNLEVPKTADVQSQVNLRAVTLSTVSSYVEWMDFEVMLMEDCKLLHLLYSFLEDESLKTPACECLLYILSRKGDVKRTAKQRKELMILLTKNALDGFKAASFKASEKILQESNEGQYIFLKRMCQILVQLGISQLGPLWLNDKDSFQPPADFELYLEGILEFTRHDSQLLSLTSSDVWSLFISHNHIKDNQCFKTFLPKVLTVCREKLAKFGDPTQNIHISSAYSAIDFDGVDEFTNFFSNFRCKMTRLITQLTSMMPRTAAKEAGRVVQELIQYSDSEYTKNSLEYLKWDGFVSYVECWTSTFKSNPDHLEIDVVKEQGLLVLSQLVAYNTKSTVLLQCQFRCLQSGLVSFLCFDDNLFKAYVEKIFSSVGFMGGGTDKYNLSKEVVATRNYIITSFTHLCDTHPTYLTPCIDYLTQVYRELVQRDELVYAEKCYFMEALIILSIEAHDLQQQKQFLKEMLQEVNMLFTEMQSCVSSVNAFIMYFCLDKDPSDPTYQPRRRLSLCHIVHSVSLMLRRSKPLSDIPSISDPREHPTFYLVLPLLVNFCIPLLSVLYELWSGQYNSRLSDHFREFDHFHPFEHDSVIGRTMLRRQDEINRVEVKSLQMNLSGVHEGCLQAIARALHLYGARNLYDMKISELAYNAIFPRVVNLNPWRLRAVLRHLISPMVSSCPEDCWDDVLYPFLSPICQLTFMTLRESWNKVEMRQAAQQSDEETSDDKSESEEVFFEQLTTVLSREYFNLLELMCVKKTGRKRLPSQDMSGDVEMAEAEAGPSEQSSEQWSLFYSLTPLGEKLLEKEEMRDILFFSAFFGLAWNDTSTSSKSTCIAGLIYEKLANNVILTKRLHIIPDLFIRVLSALRIHGIHDHVRSQLSFLALLIYQSAFAKCPEIEKILVDSYQVNQSKIQAFNRLLQKKPPASLKTKKDRFKELISSVIGKHIAESYRHRLKFDLPEMEFKKKPKQDEIGPVDLSNLFKETS